ncbi:MAG: DUF1707 SHOCT-like domain-containing protein [Nocardioidaceae bacterium]
MSRTTYAHGGQSRPAGSHELLREHFVLGRFEVEEFSRRVGVLLAARTTDQAVAVLDDLAPLPDGGAMRRSRPRRRSGGRHGQEKAAQTGWLPTTERFRDPSSGVVMRVWFDPADQSRHYVPELAMPSCHVQDPFRVGERWRLLHVSPVSCGSWCRVMGVLPSLRSGVPGGWATGRFGCRR